MTKKKGKRENVKMSKLEKCLLIPEPFSHPTQIYLISQTYSLCFIHGQILLQCLSRTQNLAVNVMLFENKP